MRHNSLRQKSGTRTSHRLRREAAANARQYSLFGPIPPAPSDDMSHFQRQARLCERLLSGLHQPELVALLGQLHDEFEAKAALGRSLPATTE
jgi:hypothetical protein